MFLERPRNHQNWNQIQAQKCHHSFLPPHSELSGPKNEKKRKSVNLSAIKPKKRLRSSVFSHRGRPNLYLSSLYSFNSSSSFVSRNNTDSLGHWDGVRFAHIDVDSDAFLELKKSKGYYSHTPTQTIPVMNRSKHWFVMSCFSIDFLLKPIVALLTNILYIHNFISLFLILWDEPINHD